jgi:hypothetical protein
MAFVARLARLAYPALLNWPRKAAIWCPRETALARLYRVGIQQLKLYDFRRDLWAAGQQLLHLQGVC